MAVLQSVRKMSALFKTVCPGRKWCIFSSIATQKTSSRLLSFNQKFYSQSVGKKWKFGVYTAAFSSMLGIVFYANKLRNKVLALVDDIPYHKPIRHVSRHVNLYLYANCFGS